MFNLLLIARGQILLCPKCGKSVNPIYTKPIPTVPFIRVVGVFCDNSYCDWYEDETTASLQPFVFQKRVVK